MNRMMWFFRMLSLTIALALMPNGKAGADDDLGGVLSSLPVIRGEAISADGLDDQVVLVAFFASWCPPCKYEFPHLNSVHAAYGQEGLTIVAINVFETFEDRSTPARLETFLDDVEPTFPILEGDGDTRRIFGNLDRIPTMFLFRRDGTLDFVFRHERGAKKTHLTEAELRDAIEPLL